MIFRIKMTIIFAAALLLTVYAQYVSTNVNAATSPLEKGLPEIVPGMHFKIKTVNPEFAWINPGEGLSGLYFLADKQKHNEYKFWIAVVYNDGETMIHTLEMKPGNPGNFTGIFEVAGKEKINLLFNSAEEILFYSRSSGDEEFSAFPVISSGKSAGGLSFVGASGNSFDLKNYEGKIVVLNWLANHKVPGIDMMNSFLKKFGADSMIVIINAADKGNVSGTGRSGNLMNYIAAYASSESLKMLGSDKPQTIIIGRDGKVKFCEPLERGFKYNAVDSVLNVLKER